MCQLLGVSSNKPVSINFSLQEFQKRGESNSHGFGFSFYKDGVHTPDLIKKPSSLFEENIARDEFKFKSKLIIGHVRYASCGNKSHRNTHPFVKDKWSFAHNGTVNEIKNWTLKTFHPEGETDSEYAFCCLLDKLKSLTELAQIVRTIEAEADIITKLGYFNFLLSNGEYLFAYGDNSLYFTKREPPFNSVTLRDTGYHINLGEIKDPDEVAIIVATKPLTKEEQWIKIEGLKIFKDGKIITV